MSRAEVEAESRDLEPGQTVRVVCPFCGGGSDGERSMAITKNADSGVILYICFRGHCGESGVIGNAGNVVRTTNAMRFQPYNWSEAIPINALRVPSWVREQIREWHMTEDEVDEWLWSPVEDRILMPVKGPLAELRGFVRRGARGRTPKVLTGRVREEQPFIGWHLQRTPSRYLILVEDVPSARRLEICGAEAVALAGCTPSDEALEEIVQFARHSRQSLVWALDPDATSNAIRYCNKTSLRVPSKVQVLEQDIKDMTYEEVACLLNDL